MDMIQQLTKKIQCRTIELFMGTKRQKYELQPKLRNSMSVQNQTVLKQANFAVQKNTKLKKQKK